MADYKSKTELNADEIRWVLDDTFSSIPINQTLKKIGMTRKEFNEYLRNNPNVKKEWEQAQVDACPFIENDLLNVQEKFDGKQGSHKLAAVWSNNAMRILESRKPDKYGRKIDMNLNQNVSIKDNIEKAAGRLQQALRDVGPQLLETIAKKELNSKK